MKELDPLVFWSVFQEMLGFWLYVIVAVALVATVLFLRAILQEHGLNARRLVWSQVVGLVGGLAALWFMWTITSSSIRDVGGPIDALLVLGIYLLGWGGATMLFYAVAGFTRAGSAKA
jgi:uncharacterized membrane protein YhaH (DUF805 family)